MITLELFIFPSCACKESVLAIAKKAVEEVPCVKLILRSDPADQKRAKSLGSVISPTFVLDGEIWMISEPRLEHLISELKVRSLRN